MSIASVTFNNGSKDINTIFFKNGKIVDKKNKQIGADELKNLTQDSTSILVSVNWDDGGGDSVTLTGEEIDRLQQALISFQQTPTSKTGPSVALLGFAKAPNIQQSISAIRSLFDEDASSPDNKTAKTLQAIHLLNAMDINDIDQGILDSMTMTIDAMTEAIDKISPIPSAEFIKSTTDAIKTFTDLINAADEARIDVRYAKDALTDALTGIATAIERMDNLDEAAKAAKDVAEAIKAAKKAGIPVDDAENTLRESLEGLASIPPKEIKKAKNVVKAIKAAEKAGIDVKKAKKALSISLKDIATAIESMDNPDEAAKTAKDLAEAINAADKAGIPVNDAKKALADSLKTIAPKVIDLSTDKASEAVTNLGNAIKTAGLEPKGIGNAGIMCKLVADEILKPTGNGKFTVGSKSGFPDGTNGRIWLEGGKFQMEITGAYDPTLIKGLAEFKEKINSAFNPHKPIKINPKALEASDVQKALKKNAFIFYDFTGEPPIMFTQRKNHFGKLESSALSYDGNAWHKAEKPKSGSTAPDFTGTSQQHSDSSQLKINTNNVTNANSNNSDEQLRALLELLKAYRAQAKQSAAKKQQPHN